MNSHSAGYPRLQHRAYKPPHPTIRDFPDSQLLQLLRRTCGYISHWLGVENWRTLPAHIKHELVHPQFALRIRRTLTTVNALILIWFLGLYLGERLIFQRSVEACKWTLWEDWPSDAKPHHLILIADPQLVDPHTYPGRPWPLSSITVRYTDLYLLKSYSLLQQELHPDSLFFLGDLFDGGREWSTYHSKSPETRFQRYGETFWLNEYNRFARIFFERWNDGLWKGLDHQEPRRIIASLPGNHDLGFGIGIQKPVRDRFSAYFGEGNRVDIVGNHTFVSLDTVSLSARDPINLGSSAELWKPTADFLDDAKAFIKRVINKELMLRQGLPSYGRREHIVAGPSDPTDQTFADLTRVESHMPTILLTHVPLYRPPGTPCGPLREHWPPSVPATDQSVPLELDDRNAISVSGGYQYQNVLTPEITRDILDKVGTIDHVFSGDDHDYCDIIHQGYSSAPNGLREITVKSMSLAMGVRKPGFLMLSLWNPIDLDGNAIAQDPATQKSIQSHLCLLPDQLGIFLHYGLLLCFTLAFLLIRAVVLEFRSPRVSTSSPTLPTSRGWKDDRPDWFYSSTSDIASTSSSLSKQDSLSTRTARTRGSSPIGGYGLPPSASDETTLQGCSGEKDESSRYEHPSNPPRGLFAVAKEFMRSSWRVAWVVLLWYTWLVWNV